MIRFVAYHLLALAMFIGGACLVSKLPNHAATRFANAHPAIFFPWVLGMMFAGFYAAGLVTYYPQKRSLASAARLSVLTALISTLATLAISAVMASFAN